MKRNCSFALQNLHFYRNPPKQRGAALQRPPSPQLPGEIAEDLAYYLLTSEQVPSTISLGVLVARDYSIAASGGFLVQALPGARDEDLARVEANITCIGPITSYLSGHPDGEELA